METTKVSITPPIHFTPSVDVVVCFIQKKEQFLMLKKREEQVWTSPGGRVEDGEILHTAIAREIKEETGLFFDQTALREIGCLYFDSPSLRFPMYIYHSFVKEVTVKLSEEHDAFDWYTMDEMYRLEKQPGATHVLDFFFARLGCVVNSRFRHFYENFWPSFAVLEMG